jgi:hypothetical protein
MLPDRDGLPLGMSSEAARDTCVAGRDCVAGCDGVPSAVSAGGRFERVVLKRGRGRP